MANKFEENLKRLEEIVEGLEEGGMSLDESLTAFERGVKLSKACHKELDQAQKKVELLLDQEEQKTESNNAED